MAQTNDPMNQFKEKALSKIRHLHEASQVLTKGNADDVRQLASSWGIQLDDGQATDLIDMYKSFYQNAQVVQIQAGPGGGSC